MSTGSLRPGYELALPSPEPDPCFGVRTKGSRRPTTPRSTARLTGAESPTPRARVRNTSGRRRFQGRDRRRPAAA